MIDERYCILDTECYAPSGEPDPEQDELRYIGFKSFSGNYRIYHYTQHEEIQRALGMFEYYIGHNINNYDRIILDRYGLKIKGIIIDTYQIVDHRCKSMMYLDLNKGDRSLDKLLERFKAPINKLIFDYSLLSKNKLENEEYNKLELYLKADLDGTDWLFKYFYNIFFGFKELVSKKDIKRMSWLTCSAGAITYKVLCNLAGLKEEYDEDIKLTNEVQYEGAFVSIPYRDSIEGNIYCFDFNSLYPHMFIGGNLYSISNSNTDFWSGSGVYVSIFENDFDGITGSYKKEQGKIEKVIHELFLKRKTFSKDDPRNLAYKIVINTAYGISGNAKFKSLFNLTTASDCTAMARRSIKHARTVLQKNGYEVIYSDTDSVYVLDTYNDEKKLEDLCDDISRIQKESFNIYVDTHKLSKECNIKRMYFFRDDKGEFIKKHYIYVKDNDDVITKGMQVIKGNASPISKKIYDEIIKPLILNGSEIIKEYDYWKEIYQEYAKKYPELLVKRFRVWPIETYKIAEGKEEATGLHAQISKRYGAGEYWLILNSRIGAGKGNRYAKIEELKEKLGEEWHTIVKVNEYMKDIREFIWWKDRNKLNK